RADDGEFLLAVGNARPLDQAVQHATTELMLWLADDYGLDYRAGSALLGQLIRYDPGNVFDPAYTTVAKIEKRHRERLAACPGRYSSGRGGGSRCCQSTKLARYAVRSAKDESISIIVALRAPREPARMSPGGEISAVQTA